MILRESIPFGESELTLETGRMAKQASGSVLVTLGETVVLVTAVSGGPGRGGDGGGDFVPLTCEFQEKMYAAGRIPGSFFRREGRPGERGVLVARLMDRPLRPLFPKGWTSETQVIATVLSMDNENDPDVLCIIGASASLHLSNIPWSGPLGATRVGRLDGKFVVNPSTSQREQSELDIIIVGSRDAIVMVEGSARDVPEEIMLEALLFGHQAIQSQIALQEQLRAAAGKEKKTVVAPVEDPELARQVRELAEAPLREALFIREKLVRYGRIDAIHKEIDAQLIAPGAPLAGRGPEVDKAFQHLKAEIMRGAIVNDGRRIDGRRFDEVRPITCEVGLLPRTHGSALFTRGETQALVTVTLGTRRDEQRVDALTGEYWERFMLHYNFPPFCVGEAKMLRGTSRREIGHGNLAKRAVQDQLPDVDSFPYTLRIVSEILESNGSSSMATVCGSTLALMDAGVHIKAPVAGAAMGLIKEGDKVAILTDILGDEDHLGDMDFKVCGTRQGVTALQMDIKISGLSREVMVQALEQARTARLHILDVMTAAMPTTRSELSQHAPRILVIRVKPDKIRDVIGPGGKTIKGIVEQTGAQVNVEDDGTVTVASPDLKAAQRAIAIIKGLTEEPEIGRVYMGTVVKIAEFGAFVEILPGTDGLCHISELSDKRVNRVEDILHEGDEVPVKVLAIDRQGKIKLSRREALAELARRDGGGSAAPAPQAPPAE
ncbi:MAG: polyribonucleotide nucleotidyltransferase [Myxococcota bacterium]|jgi:polyribonucleotide nucleotidyltransferase|nr:polyribonucleotide nucleotidyltransferase [Myxococcota bacterium]